MTTKLENKIGLGLFLNILLYITLFIMSKINGPYGEHGTFYVVYGFVFMPLHLLACFIMLLNISYNLFTLEDDISFSKGQKILIFVYYFTVFLFFYILFNVKTN